MSTYKDKRSWIELKHGCRVFSYPINKIIDYFDNTTATTNTDSNNRQSISLAVKDDSNITLPSRLVDYFITIGLNQQQEIHIGTSDKTSELLPEDVSFTPTVLSHYPDIYKDNPIPELLSSFVFSGRDATLSSRELSPSSFTFVLTDQNGQKIYVAALYISELVGINEMSTVLGSDNINRLQRQIVYAPKVLVLLSHYPLFHLFTEFLARLYHLSLSSSPLPIERYVVNFVKEVPLPPKGITEISYTLPGYNYRISRPPRNKMPAVDFSYRPLFATLSNDTIMMIFFLLCLEEKVVVSSSIKALLTPTLEALLSFLFPLVWQVLSSSLPSSSSLLSSSFLQRVVMYRYYQRKCLTF